MVCPKCGMQIEDDIKCCPNCGTDITTNQQITSSYTLPTEKVDTSNSTPQKKHFLKKKCVIGAIIIILLIVMWIIGNNASEPDVKLIEADNDYGLSTEITLEEFVDYYNENLANMLNLTDKLFRQLNCIDIENPYKVIEEHGLTEYIYAPPGSEQTMLQQNVLIGVDSQTGYVVLAQLRFVSDAYNSFFTTDEARNGVDARAISIFHALGQGDSEKASRIMEYWLDTTGTQWDSNIVYMAGTTSDGIEVQGFTCCTEDAYNKIFGS